MNKTSRRKFLKAGLATGAGLSGLGVAAKLAQHYGLVPPDSGGIYGPGETLSYAAHRIFSRHSLAREFPRAMISKDPFPNAIAPLSDNFKRLQSSGFVDWRLSVEGMVAQPATLSLSDLKTLPMRSQITEVVCEEGWSYIAEWIGTPLHEVLKALGVLPQARYLVYFSMEPDWWDSIDMDDALHPQTLLAYGMNGQDLPTPHGAPIRLRVPRQLGYKSLKYLAQITVVDSLKDIGQGLGSISPELGYSWYAGI